MRDHSQRFRRHAFDDRFDVIAFVETGRVQTIGAGFRISDQPLDDLVDLFAANQKTFRASDKQHASAMKRFAHSVDSLHCKIDIIKRTFLAIGCVFD